MLLSRRETHMRANSFMLRLILFVVVAVFAAPACVAADESRSSGESGLLNLVLRVQTSDESRVSFDGLLLVSVRDRELETRVYLRFQNEDGEAVDTYRFPSKSKAVKLNRNDLFSVNATKGSQSLRFLVYAPGYQLGEDLTFVDRDEEQLPVRIVLKSHSELRAIAKKNRKLPKVSRITRTSMTQLGPIRHREILDQMEKEARAVEQLEAVRKKPRKIVLTPSEEQTVENSLRIIRGCQLMDGAFVMKTHGTRPGDPVWVPPYFVNYSVLALLAENDGKKNPGDLKRVAAWLEWCAVNQQQDGYWFHFEGTVGNYSSHGRVDAWDRSAAMFLVVVKRFRRSGGQLTPAVVNAARKSLGCINAVIVPSEGLTWATTTYKVKFLMDSIDTGAGLAAETILFRRLGEEDESSATESTLLQLSASLQEYWQEDRNLFAFARHENGTFETGLLQRCLHGLAQLFAIAFLDQKEEASNQVQTRFAPDESELAADGVERRLSAASKMKPEVEEAWRLRVANTAKSCKPESVYIYHLGIPALTRLVRADWLPVLSDEESGMLSILRTSLDRHLSGLIS